jgi:hypothetical protein
MMKMTLDDAWKDLSLMSLVFVALLLKFGQLIKVKIHYHPLGFDLVANRLSGVLILQYNYLRFLNW